MTKPKAAPAQKRKASPARKAEVDVKVKPKAKAKAQKAAPVVFAKAEPAKSGEKPVASNRDALGRQIAGMPSLNPAGKPKGARHSLATDFVKALATDFATHGAAAIRDARENNSAAYLKTIAAILPKVIEIEDEDGEGKQVTGVLYITKSRINDLIGAQ